MSRNVRITLLCEDAQHVTFAKKLLQALGWQLRDFRIERSPSSRGSAEQFVRERFPIELRGLRSKRGEKAYLVVMIDGDDKGVAGRRASLDAAAPRSCRPGGTWTSSQPISLGLDPLTWYGSVPMSVGSTSRTGVLT